ncbi:unnamed protein product [Prorocentrum cordatum]|uniref:Uncharacterized protein n=1 Tax=Prorocentrum cordatum TaxID=2364126 RepID=A0ABN9STS5_9DINO|nr:unnamed protein product [Polarella glacialis]
MHWAASMYVSISVGWRVSPVYHIAVSHCGPHRDSSTVRMLILHVVLDHLRRSAGVGPIALWGRSMGAATSVLRAAEDRGLAACVLDSPFCSLPDVARELAQSTKLKMPEVMVGAMLRRIRAEIKARADVDIEDLRPIDFAPRAVIPALFAVAKDDEFVRAHHTYALHDAWAGEERELVTLGGGHNSPRPREFHAHAADFLQEHAAAAVAARRPHARRRQPRRAPGRHGGLSAEALGD